MSRTAPKLAAVDAPVQSGATAPPSHLSAEAAAWWCETLADYALDGHHLRQLQIAAEAWDRAQLARKELATHGGLTFRDGNGNIRAHPAVAIQRDAAILFNRTLRELDLDGAGPGEGPRPPALPSNRR